MPKYLHIIARQATPALHDVTLPYNQKTSHIGSLQDSGFRAADRGSLIAAINLLAEVESINDPYMYATMRIWRYGFPYSSYAVEYYFGDIICNTDIISNTLLPSL